MPRNRITVCRPGRPAWPVRTAPPPASLGYLLFVGTLEPRKNLGGLLEAYGRLVARNPQAPPLRAGRADASPNRRRCWRSSTSLPSPDASSIAATSPTRSGAALYAGATALILPSFLEGFGLPVLEAMTVGVPVIASDRGALPEVLGDAGLLVSPDDPEELAAAMQRVVTGRAAGGDAGRPRRPPIADLRLDRLGDDAARDLRGADAAGAAARAAAAAGAGMRIAVDARELAPHPTGVGRYLLEILQVWARDPAAADCDVTLYAPHATSISRRRACTAPAPASARACCPAPAARRGNSCGCRFALLRRRRRALRAGLLGAALRAGAHRRSRSTTCRSARTRSGSGRAKACAAAGPAGSRRPTRRPCSPSRPSRATKSSAGSACRRRACA